MKVIHFSTTDYGGAFKAASRISESMINAGVESRVIVRTKTSEDSHCEEIFSTNYERFLSKLKNLGNLLCSRGEVISDYLGTDITTFPFFDEADVIVLHWVNSFIPYHVVKKIVQIGKPTIWVMHDMWLFTGGCHYDQYCGGYEQGCTQCPMIYNKHGKRIALNNFRRKAETLGKNITFVSPSNYILREAKKSDILADKCLVNIPNPIDTSLYKPLPNRNEIREKYGVYSEKKIILFGADNSLKAPNKGYKYLVKALELLSEEEYMAVIFGNRETPNMSELIRLETKFLGFVEKEEELVQIYNMADVFVAPSDQDNYPNSVLEALSCGVPVTAFNIGGMPELIEHKKNGYIAEFKNVADLADGLCFCCLNRIELKETARNRVMRINDYDVIGRRYETICKAILENS